MARFKIMGITDDVTNCECCGRTDLKRTVILGILDADRNVIDVTHYGSNCAAKAMSYCRTAKAIERSAEQAQRDAEQAKRNRTVAVDVNPVLPNALWVIETFDASGGNPERLCFATGTRPAIREWAAKEYPYLSINVRAAI